jgi:Tol biopolymer transport system component
MRNRAISAVLLGLAFLCCSRSVSAMAAPRVVPGSPRCDLVLFRGGEAETCALWTVWGDGSHLTRLRGIGLNEGGAVWSPDSSKIAFEHWLSLLPDIQVLDVSTGSIWYITGRDLNDPATWCHDVTWSPDGRTIYAGTFADRIVSIDVTDLANPGEPRLLTDAPPGVYEGGPACGPDGRIAYVSSDYDSGSIGIRLFDPATGEDRQVIGGVTPTPPGIAGGPIAWSPDARYLAYRLYPESWPGAVHLAVAPADGELPNFGTVISGLGGYGFAWSRTGRHIYCAENGNLYRMKADGTSVRMIVSGDEVGGSIMEPSVAPNADFPPGRAGGERRAP